MGVRGPRRRRDGSVWAITMVRDEADIVSLVIDHLLRQGVDTILIADNGSVDGTLELLAERAFDNRRIILLRDHESAYYQAEKMSNLARVAWWLGADWVVPVDGDEFWFAEGMLLAEWLRGCGADVVHASLHHMVPVDPGALGRRTAFLLDASQSIPGKTALRSHPLALVGPGNHDAMRVGERVAGLRVAHVPYRGPRQIARKFRQGLAAHALAEGTADVGGHWAKGAAMSDDVIDDVWRTISGGLPSPRVDFPARGPMVRCQPLAWETWDTDHVVPINTVRADLP